MRDVSLLSGNRVNAEGAAQMQGNVLLCAETAGGGIKALKQFGVGALDLAKGIGK